MPTHTKAAILGNATASRSGGARRRGSRLMTTAAASLALASSVLIGATSAEAGTVHPNAYPRGYVTDGYLRAQATTNSAALARIQNQSVEIVCYTQGQYVNGTAKWFRAQYYSTVGYLSASVVSNQPTVGGC